MAAYDVYAFIHAFIHVTLAVVGIPSSLRIEL